MNLNHPFETCHVSQTVDGSLVLIKLSGRLCLAFKGFEILADSERTDFETFEGQERADQCPKGAV